MSFQTFVTQRLSAITDTLNAISVNAKKIDELPEQTTLDPLAKIHVSKNGISKSLVIQKIIDAVSKNAYNSIVSIGNITISGNTLTVPGNAVWKINNIIYTRVDATLIQVPYTATGLIRTDILVANNLSEIIKIAGVEASGIAVRPNIPINTVLICEINVNSTVVGSPIYPLVIDTTANHFRGNYDIATNQPTLVNGVGKIGDEYRCTTAGVRDFGSGNITVSVNDVLMYNGAAWFLKVNNNQATKAHNHLSTDITDLNETVEDIIGTKIKAGENVSVEYNDVTGETTVSSAGGVDATALHKTGDESFTGVKTANSTDALPAGFDINNNGGVRGFVNKWFNVIAGTFNYWVNQSTGVFNSWKNQSSGIFNSWQNIAGGLFNSWENSSSGIFNNWVNYATASFNNWYNGSTGVFTIITSATASTGDLFQFFKDSVKTASINHLGHFTSNKFINPTGQGFLKANGNIDTNTYKLDTPFFRHYGALLFDGITQTGHQDIPLGAGVDGKLEVTIYGLYQGANISGSCSAVIDVFMNAGNVYRNDLKHKDVNTSMASQYEIQGVVAVGGVSYLRIKKLTALQNFISVAIKYQGTNHIGLYAPSNPLPFVAGVQNPSEVQNVKLVLTNTTLVAKDWVNVNQILQVYTNFATPSTLTLASGIETKGLVTQIINVGTPVATIAGASTGTITLNTNQGTTIISNGNNIKLH